MNAMYGDIPGKGGEEAHGNGVRTRRAGGPGGGGSTCMALHMPPQRCYYRYLPRACVVPSAAEPLEEACTRLRSGRRHAIRRFSLHDATWLPKNDAITTFVTADNADAVRKGANPRVAMLHAPYYVLPCVWNGSRPMASSVQRVRTPVRYDPGLHCLGHGAVSLGVCLHGSAATCMCYSQRCATACPGVATGLAKLRAQHCAVAL